jgi:SAM-dependent methyltransferase
MEKNRMHPAFKSSLQSSFLLFSAICRVARLKQFQSRDGFTSRQRFLEVLNACGSVLEIGPFYNPVVRGTNVKYFDILDQQGLMARARDIGQQPEGCPHIDFISDRGHMDVIGDAKFDNVVSSHCIEHQADLIGHLNEVSKVLRPGGRYYLIVPDKRFMADHYLPLTRVSEVLAARIVGRELPSHESIIAHFAETTHSSPRLHWMGFHRQLRVRPHIERLTEALKQASKQSDYVDVHCWTFTPTSFYTILNVVLEMEWIDLEIERVYGTSFCASEFFAVLRKRQTK